VGSHEELITEMVKAYTSRANPRPFDMRQAMRDVLAIVQNRMIEPIEAELAEARRERDMARAERDTLLMDVGEFVKWFARHYPEPSQHPDHPWCVINARL